ncbi:MAG: hypothetical protein CVU24_05645 [Betaproteobacteria bacterium HGW-Betaproteobacteria-18]|nr:MAG: hypothetical protein CVU24_05645 [Betaproteobacteria bacterium HGW-Betaproteobacteria-18]
MWREFLPVALLPLWQLVQLVAGVKLPWSTLLAGSQAVVLWQLSQEACVGTWPEILPGATLPL